MPEYTRILDGIVHEPTQTTNQGFDLTVNEIYTLTGPGRLDFGGDELESATITPHQTTKRNPDDDYAWWELSPGTYLVEFNETVTIDDVTLTVQPCADALERGAFHPTLHVSSLPRIPLSVGDGGIKIKANARLSTIPTIQRG